MRYNMRAERVRKGLTVKEVAHEIGVHENAVTRWENGEAEPLGTNLVKMAKLYGCAPDYLLDLTEERRPVAPKKDE